MKSVSTEHRVTSYMVLTLLLLLLSSWCWLPHTKRSRETGEHRTCRGQNRVLFPQLFPHSSVARVWSSDWTVVISKSTHMAQQSCTPGIFTADIPPEWVLAGSNRETSPTWLSFIPRTDTPVRDFLEHWNLKGISLPEPAGAFLGSRNSRYFESGWVKAKLRLSALHWKIQCPVQVGLDLSQKR